MKSPQRHRCGRAIPRKRQLLYHKFTNLFFNCSKPTGFVKGYIPLYLMGKSGCSLTCGFGRLSFSLFLLLHLSVVIAWANRPMVLSDLYSPCRCVGFPYVRHSAHDWIKTFVTIMVMVPSRMAPAPQKPKTSISFCFFFFLFLCLPEGKQVSDNHWMPPCAGLNLRHSIMGKRVFLVMVCPFFF